MMNVEQTIKFILESQARAETRADRADARADRADARLDRLEKKNEREMAAIRKLLQQGMKSLAQLTAAQKETDRELRAFIQSLRNGGSRGNGKGGH
jgi:hypothetical protein